ncbi:hypothetical protein V6N13_076668 [Hibiscus sabdariffa]|uniref:Uncharacterized protein n=1 Tax=Hibiscus sabdariffa TaxID=183260 RepID=A0ABR2NP43_9ROSI
MAATVTNEKQNHSVGFKGEGMIARAFLSFSKCINKNSSTSCDNPFDARITSCYGITIARNKVLKDKKMVANPHPESYGIYYQIFDTLVVDMKWREKDAILELSTKKGTYSKVNYQVKIVSIPVSKFLEDDNFVSDKGMETCVFGSKKQYDCFCGFGG